MNSKPMLFECIDCKETYLADNLCNGCKCPKCNGRVASRGFIKEIEERLKDMQDKVNRAKENGLIRKYNISVEPKNIYGVDYATDKDITIKASFNAEEFKKDTLKELNKTIRLQRSNISKYIHTEYE